MLYRNKLFFAAGLFAVAVSALLPGIGVPLAAAADNGVAASMEAEARRLAAEWRAEPTRRARELLEQAADEWEKAGNAGRAAECLNEIARLSPVDSDQRNAMNALARALIIERRHGLRDQQAVTLSLLALIHHETGDKLKFQTEAERVLGMTDQASSHEALGYANYAAGMYQYYHGKLADATRHFETASAHAQQTENIHLRSQSLFFVGFSYMREGTPARAGDVLDLALRQSRDAGYLKGTALSYFALGMMHHNLTERQKALEMFATAESMLPPDFEWKEKARIYNIIGIIFQEFGEQELAGAKFQQAYQSYTEADYTLGKTAALTNLADTQLARSMFADARRNYETAMSLALKLDDKFRLANVTEGLGSVAFAENDIDTAIEKFRETLKMYDGLGVRMPHIENLLGRSYEALGDLTRAKELYRSSAARNREIKDNLQLADDLYQLARVSLKEGRLVDAETEISESIELGDSLYLSVKNAGLKRKFVSRIFERYELYIRVIVERNKGAGGDAGAAESLAAVERARARSMLENMMLADVDLTADAPRELVEREQQTLASLNAKADKLTDMLSSNAAGADVEKVRSEIAELEHRLEELKAELRLRSPLYSAIREPGKFDVSDLRSNALDSRTVLVEFLLGRDESYLWVVDKSGTALFVLPPQSVIDEKTGDVLSLLTARQRRADEPIDAFQARVAGADQEYWTKAHDLSRTLFGQAAERLRGKRLLVVPDGKLHYFPLSALPLPDDDTDTAMLTTNEVDYLPSAQTLLLLKRRSGPNAAERPRDLLVFSDPVFARGDERLSGTNTEEPVQASRQDNFRFVESLNSLARLPGSADEASDVAGIVGLRRSDVLNGFAANRAALLNTNAAAYKVVHFATHGIVDRERPELSGIVLSRYAPDGGQIDEFVRLNDIYGMKFNADLVVLSACDTGVGKEMKGEGLVSLNNAFLQSGARSVMSSLWKVEDGAARMLMTEFYANLAAGRTPSESLRLAQLHLAADPRYNSPFYWAAFTLNGDPNIKVELGGVSWFVPAAAVLIACVFGAFVYWRREWVGASMKRIYSAVKR